MIARIAADLILAFHFSFVLFALFGWAGALLWSWWPWTHLPVVLWSSAVNLAGWTCPLTPLEKRFRAASGQAGYPGGFIEHYLGPLVYPGGMPRRLELVAGISVLLWNAIAYSILYSLRGAH